MAPEKFNAATDKLGQTSAADSLWYDPVKAIAQYRLEMEDVEKLLAKIREKNVDILVALEAKLKKEDADAEVERQKALLEKKLKLEKALNRKLSKYEEELLEKKSARDKKKKEKDQKQLARKEQSDAAAESLRDNLKHFNLGGALKDLGKLAKNIGSEIGPAVGQAAKQALVKTLKQGIESVDEAMKTLAGVYSKVNARLQDSGESFKSINDNMRKLLIASPFVKYNDMLTKIDELVNLGVAYNVELRAFLASMTDKIATTFDAFDSNLLRIIRIQQEDSTKLRLGMEAKLTSFLNSNYQDTSYLSGAHDSVTEALTASIVQLGTARGAEYEFAIQKWFGSLSALGVGDSTLTGLAGAINAAATGDIENLSSSQFMNLIVMAANKAGISYADILTKGLNAESVNSLLEQIVLYWSTIASETNQVVKNQYSKIFGVDMIDLTAIRNINATDLNTITKQVLSYEGMSTELTNQFGKVASRMHASELFDNVWENFLTGIGLNIASNPTSAATWMINKFIKEQTGGINIPSLGALVLGTGVSNFDLETDFNSLVLLGMVGASTLSLIGKLINGVGRSGGLDLTAWGADQFTRHGQGLSAPVTGAMATTSSVAFIGNSNSSDMYDSTIMKQKEQHGILEIESESKTTADAAKQQMENIETNVKTIADILSDVFTGGALRVSVDSYGLTNSFGG